MTVEDYQREQEIGANWIPIVQAAGMYDPALKPANLFMLAGAIMNDPEVAQRHAEARKPWADVLHEMTAADKAALKERIVQRWNR
jgi:hypothetical protein